ncbi:MAG: peptidylprolyl isomerase [Rhodoferax sp.]|nr:peptidylprolyl isomerase [Rhodoferax sp.]
MTQRIVSLLLGSLLSAALAAQAQNQPLPGAAAPGAVAAAAGQRAADYIVAIVNSEPITNQQLRAEVDRVLRQMALAQQRAPDVRELATQVLERLINDRTQLHFAREAGIRVDEAAVDEAEQNVARQNQIDTVEMYRRLAADGFDRKQFRSQLRDQLTIVRVREREVLQKVKVSELEIDQYLREKQASQDVSSMEFNIAHILVGLPDDPNATQLAAAQAKAQRLLDRARAGDDFGTLARDNSDASDAAAGGRFGLRPADRYPTLFVNAARDLAVGALTSVRSGAGIHVLKVLEKRTVGMPPSSAEQTRASHILLRLSAQVSEAAARERLSAIKKRLEAGQADFATLARENSQDGSAAQGGDLGWAAPGMFVPEFEEVMGALAPGQISEPLVSRFGVHLITVTERRTVSLSQREMRDSVRAILREKKQEDAFQSWTQELRSRAYVEMRQPLG